MAPVLPADTTPATAPARTSPMARTMGVSFFFRTAWAGGSCIAMFSAVGTISKLSAGSPSAASTLRMASGSP